MKKVRFSEEDGKRRGKLVPATSLQTAVSGGRRQEIEKMMVELQQQLSQSEVDEKLFNQSVLLLHPLNYDEVCEERYFVGLCGYPPCCNSLKQRSKLAEIHLTYEGARRGFTDADNILRFCSLPCAVNSKLFRSKLSDDSIYSRPWPGVPVSTIHDASTLSSAVKHNKHIMNAIPITENVIASSDIQPPMPEDSNATTEKPVPTKAVFDERLQSFLSSRPLVDARAGGTGDDDKEMTDAERQRRADAAILAELGVPEYDSSDAEDDDDVDVEPPQSLAHRIVELLLGWTSSQSAAYLKRKSSSVDLIVRSISPDEDVLRNERIAALNSMLLPHIATFADTLGMPAVSIESVTSLFLMRYPIASYDATTLRTVALLLYIACLRVNVNHTIMLDTTAKETRFRKLLQDVSHGLLSRDEWDVLMVVLKTE
jgi:hypothetical protein